MNRQPLKGLLLFLFFSAKGHLVMTAVIMLCATIFALTFGTTPMIGLIAMLLVPTMSLMTLASAEKAEKNKWETFQLSMPVKRQNVVTARYTFYLLLILLALLMTGIIEGLALSLNHLDVVQHGSFRLGGIGPMAEVMEALTITPIQISVQITLLSMGSSVLSAALYFPLAYSIFKGKEELVSILVLIGNFILTAFLLWLASHLEFTFNQTVMLGVLAPIFLLIPSYFFSVRFYQKLDA